MTDRDLPVDRANRIADAVEDIERNVVRLRSYQELTRDAYRSPGEHERRDATERKFVKLTEATLDIASEVCKQERGRVPERRKAQIDVLETEGIVDGDLADRLRSAVGFRDVLAHTYGPVVNDDLVYDALQNSLERYVEFVEAIDEYLDRYLDEES